MHVYELYLQVEQHQIHIFRSMQISNLIAVTDTYLGDSQGCPDQTLILINSRCVLG